MASTLVKIHSTAIQTTVPRVSIDAISSSPRTTIAFHCLETCRVWVVLFFPDGRSAVLRATKVVRTLPSLVILRLVLGGRIMSVDQCCFRRKVPMAGSIQPRLLLRLLPDVAIAGRALFRVRI